ncbi:MAG: hypothetical protein IKZ47_04830 [Clostridia bacterium]|nr:hypothetical protein [Clostridia bacterium]
MLFKHEFMHSLESRADYKSFLQYCEDKSVAFAKYAKSILSREGIAYTGGNNGAVQALFDYYYEIYTTDERIKPIDRQSFTRENAKT